MAPPKIQRQESERDHASTLSVHRGWDYVGCKYVTFMLTKPSLSVLVSILPDVVGCEGEGVVW